MTLHRILTLVLLLGPAGPALAEWPQCGATSTFPGAEWPAPEPGNWDPALLAEAESLSQRQDAGGAVMVVHGGRLVAAWGDTAEPRLVQSVRKQLLNSLVGLEVASGRLDLDDTLAGLDIDDTEPPLTRLEKRATVRDLLWGRSGIFHDAHYETGGWKRIRAKLRELEAGSDEPDALEPGEYWFYNNWDFNTLGTIVEQSAGRGIGPYFEEAIAGPLGMQDFEPGHVEYTGNGDMTAWMLDNHSDHPAYAFLISARDLARYGLLWLDCGNWNGQRVLPLDWVRASITGRDTLDGAGAEGFQKDFGYFGYLWWVDRDDRRRDADLPEDLPVYYASGSGGHRLYVFPTLDMVVAHLVDTPGGVGTFSQIRRRMFGDPDLEDGQVAAVVNLLLRAHPERPAGTP